MNNTIIYKWVRELTPEAEPWVHSVIAKEIDNRDEKIKQLEHERTALYDKLIDVLGGSE